MTARCRACLAGLEHCHGALIHHAFQRDECTEDACTIPGGGHDVQIDCGAVGCVCDEVLSVAPSAHRVG